MTEPALHRALGLTDGEFERIRTLLERDPNDFELAVFSLLWSEHCGYKHSALLLKRLPSTGPRVLQGPGENAGVLDLGDGLAVCFKVESHNHPSAVEPFQGAATGVGGILRDIVAMGARPVALLDGLRFAEPDWHFSRAVGGIGHYGNCVGVPTVGGEAVFDESYRDNCLVNAMCVGLLPVERLMRAKATAAGQLVVLYGATTGRDGIGGASVLASQELDDGSAEKRPSVQIGDPFTGKKLIEASVELVSAGLVESLQDCGAAGIASSLSEMATDLGIDVHLDRVPLREEGMEPWEVMISESQERMIAIVRPQMLEAVEAILDRWELEHAEIGEVTDDRRAARVLGRRRRRRDPGSPAHGRVALATRSRRRSGLRRRSGRSSTRRLLPKPWSSCSARLRFAAASSCSGATTSSWARGRCAGRVSTRPSSGCGRRCAAWRSRSTARAASRRLDPFTGGALAVLEAARNVACVGGEPIGFTDCLNFGNPEKAEIGWELAEAIDGIAAACEALGVPVVSGNVSLYNETNGRAIHPTPVVGAVGLVEDVRRVPTGWRDGDVIFAAFASALSLAGSEYQARYGETSGTPPPLDLARRVAARLVPLARRAAGDARPRRGRGRARGLPCRGGDLLGLRAPRSTSVTTPVELFGEVGGRAIVSCAPGRVATTSRVLRPS